jgi:transcriptional regulator with XRE-family HTH domain
MWRRGSQTRRALKITQAQLAQRISAAPATVSRIELAVPDVAMPDSAISAYRRVLSAWQLADASFYARRSDYQRRLDGLTRQNPRSATLVLR